MAPATDAGDDLEDTLRHPISVLALSVDTLYSVYVAR